MIILPADMLAASASIPPAEEWLLTCIKMPSGDVWLSDRPVSPELRTLLPAEPLAAVEDWGVLDDGGTVDGLLSTGSVGNLECPTIKITVLRADQTKAQIDAIINQGIHNRRIELYRWFTGMSSEPVLIDILFIQDKIELAESSMLWSFEAVGCLASDNPRMSEPDDKGRSWPYVIGRAQGVPLTLLESESSKWTELIGDAEGNAVTAEYTGLVRVKDASRMRTGYHLINGEYVYLSSASAGYMRLSQRGSSLTEPQEHSGGSRIFPVGAVFKYAVCAGPVGSLEKLRTSNEIDVYDDDEDGDAAEYRDLYSGENETAHPEANPAQVWFSDRMPFLWKDQENQIDDKVFYGAFSGFDNAAMCILPSDTNKEDGRSAIKINFREFSIPTGVQRGYTEPLDALVPTASESHLVGFSENLKNGKFTASQVSGDWETFGAYNEFRVNGAAGVGDEAWITAPIPDPVDKNGEYHNYTDKVVVGLIINSAFAGYMRCRYDFYVVTKNGVEFPIFTSLGNHEFGNVLASESLPAYELLYQQQFLPIVGSQFQDARLKMKMTVLETAGPSSYAWIRTGFAIEISPFPEKVFYGMWSYKQYYLTQPSAYISSTFSKNLSSRGTFISSKVKIKGTLRNTAGKATGTLKVYENGVEKYSTAVSDGSDVDQTINLSAASWLELSSRIVKAKVKLTSLSGEITEGSAGFEFDGGVQWLLTYKSTTLDELQVNYADTLYVDAVSTRGPDWTPARAVQWISQDKTTWAADILDTDALDDRHAEYVAAGHALNGIRAEERYQDVIREVLRQGSARPIQSGGKLSIVNHLTDTAALPVMTAGLDSLFSKSQTFTTTDTPQLIQKIIVNYNKNLSTGEWDGKHELATGEPVQELAQIDLDMVNSTAAAQLAAAWLYALKTVQLQVFGYAGNFKVISGQKADKINLPSFLLDNALREMLTVNVKQDFGKGKTGKMTKFLIQAIRRI
jgi:hypothetical protein